MATEPLDPEINTPHAEGLSVTPPTGCPFAHNRLSFSGSVGDEINQIESWVHYLDGIFQCFSPEEREVFGAHFIMPTFIKRGDAARGRYIEIYGHDSIHPAKNAPLWHE